MAELRFAVVGDSAMWGQGLVVANKYWLLAAGMIRQRLGSELVFKEHLIKPHSGAKISATKRERAGFIDTYPEIFRSEDEMAAFLEGDEEPAAHMFGDIPRTFPTITYQVNSISEQDGAGIDLLFLNGAANDLDFETFLHPTDHSNDFRKTYDSVFKEDFYDLFSDLVRAARRKCPNAVIIIAGYFTPFAPDDGSDFDELKEFIIFQAEVSDWKLALNWLANKFDAGVDIPLVMRQLKRRAQYGNALGMFWMRKAITDLNEDATVRGPGLIYVPSGVKPENGVWRKTSFFHQQYEADKVEDRLKEERVRQYPRVDHIIKISELLNIINSFFFNVAPSLTPEERQAALLLKLESALSPKPEVNRRSQELLAILKGPRELIDSLRKTAGAVDNSEYIVDLGGIWQSLTNELNRFNHVSIASFLHPNEAGAEHYANNIVERFDRHRRTTIREDIIRLAISLNGGTKPPIVSVKDSLKRYGLDPRIGLRACMSHMIVDSLAVRITTRPDSENTQVIVQLVIDPAEPEGFELTDLREVDRIFKPGSTDLIPLDTFGGLHLSMIKRLRLQLKLETPNTVGNPTWKPSELALLINGKEVFKSAIFNTLSLQVPEVLPYPQ